MTASLPHPQRCGSVEAACSSAASAARTGSFHTLKGVAPLKHHGDGLLAARLGPFHTLKGVAPLKLQARAGPLDCMACLPHPQRCGSVEAHGRGTEAQAQGPLPHPQRCGSVEASLARGVLCLVLCLPHPQRCGSVEASPSSQAVREIRPSFHTLKGVAPLKQAMTHRATAAEERPSTPSKVWLR